MRFKILTLVAVFLASCLAWSASGELLICPKCKYENDSGNVSCSYCGEAFPNSPGPATISNGEAIPSLADAPVPALAIPRKTANIDPAVIRKELDTANAYLEKNLPWMAFFYAENAMALNMISTGDTDLADRFPAIIRQCEKKIRTAPRKCPFCKGSGKTRQTVEMVGLDGQTSSHTAAEKPCQICGGRGTVSGQADQSALVKGYTQTIKQYSVIRMSEKWVPLGQAWIPGNLDGQLSPEQMAFIRRTIGGSCPDCIGFGKVSCSRCGGTGKNRCTAAGCKDGFVSKKLVGLMTKTHYSFKKEPCPKCKGTAIVTCTECEGSAIATCQACNGTGKLPICPECHGQGLSACNKCDGSGKFSGGTCPACEGNRRKLCSMCGGDGRRQQF